MVSVLKFMEYVNLCEEMPNKTIAVILRELLPGLASPTLNATSIVDQIYDRCFRNIVSSSAHTKDVRNSVVNTPAPPPSPPSVEETTSTEDVWIFGYGSLVWKADFPFIDRRRGFICSYQRRFYQHSIDHRGTPNKPGRVVTLLPTDNAADRVYGVAYRIAAAQKTPVLQHLDYREKNGYVRRQLMFHEFPESTGRQFEVIMYVATHENDSYAGEVWQLPRIAAQIITSAGPSGPNREYLFNLAHAMRDHFPGVHDEHLHDLLAEVWRLIETEEQPALERALKKKIADIVRPPKDGGKEVAVVREEDAEALAEELSALLAECSQRNWKETLLAGEMLPTS